MPASDDLIAALEAAVAGQPASVALRLHLASTLLEAGRAADALAQCDAVLGQSPDNAEALRLAVRTADASDDPRAAVYRRLLAVLGSSAAPEDRGDAATAGVAPPGPDGPAAAVTADGGAAEREAESAGASPLRLHVVDAADAPDSDGVERPRVTLEDVGGMENVKQRLHSAFLAPMRNPAMRAMYGKSLRGGLLLFGPPGCGKTFIARATAGELGAKFYAVGLSDVLDMYFGQSERNLHQIFEVARRNAPCVLFVDEVDALGQRRTNVRAQAMWRSVIAQFLAEMDSLQSDNEGVFVLAATNHPWDVDTALRRPGRFDRTLLVLPPDRAAREAILRYHMRGRPVAELDWSGLAGSTDGYSGADLAHLCETAAECAMDESLRSGTARPIGMHDMEMARRAVTPSTAGWFQVAKNFAMFANEGGVYDELLDYMRAHRLG